MLQVEWAECAGLCWGTSVLLQELEAVFPNTNIQNCKPYKPLEVEGGVYLHVNVAFPNSAPIDKEYSLKNLH